MDFDKEYMEKNGHGKYEQLDVSLLPKLWLAYVADPDDSGKVHSKVKQRFLNGDEEVSFFCVKRLYANEFFNNIEI